MRSAADSIFFRYFSSFGPYPVLFQLHNPTHRLMESHRVYVTMMQVFLWFPNSWETSHSISVSLFAVVVTECLTVSSQLPMLISIKTLILRKMLRFSVRRSFANNYSLNVPLFLLLALQTNRKRNSDVLLKKGEGAFVSKQSSLHGHFFQDIPLLTNSADLVWYCVTRGLNFKYMSL